MNDSFWLQRHVKVCSCLKPCFFFTLLSFISIHLQLAPTRDIFLRQQQTSGLHLAVTTQIHLFKVKAAPDSDLSR